MTTKVVVRLKKSRDDYPCVPINTYKDTDEGRVVTWTGKVKPVHVAYSYEVHEFSTWPYFCQTCKSACRFQDIKYTYDEDDYLNGTLVISECPQMELYQIELEPKTDAHDK